MEWLGLASAHHLADYALFVPGLLVQLGGAQRGDTARFAIPPPLDPAIAGVQLHAQAFALRSGGPLLGGFAPSPGVRIAIGDGVRLPSLALNPLALSDL